MMRIILLIFFQGTLSFNYAIMNNYPERFEMTDTTYNQIIIDSDYTLEEALSGIKMPAEIKKSLVLIEVQYYSFDKNIHQGQLVVNKDLSSDMTEIFKKIKEEKFPIAKVIPIVHYNWDDEKSMKDNNTSAFNYRLIAGTGKLSNHSFGTAIDINPLFNPYIRSDLRQPEGSEYNPERAGTITANSFLVKEFKQLGWRWGGDWKDRKDYQHFEKEVN